MDPIINEITQRCRSLNVFEQRHTTDDYLELVFLSKDIDQWQQALDDIFGAAQKPGGTKPSREDLALTKEYGKIRRNQILYHKECDSSDVIAMLWPWDGNQYVTLKVFVCEKT